MRMTIKKARSRNLLKPPGGDVGREVSHLIVVGAEHIAEPLEGLAADVDVVVFAAGVANGVPDLVELLDVLAGDAQAGAGGEQGQAGIDVLAVGAVEDQEFVDDGPVREALRLADAGGVVEVALAALEHAEIDEELILADEDIADLALVEHLGGQGNFLERLVDVGEDAAQGLLIGERPGVGGLQQERG
jgi:hypothetical protein